VATCGAAIGVALAAVVVRVFVALGPKSAPRLDQVSIDWASIAFAGAAALAAAVVLSLLTAWGTRSVRIAEALGDNSRTGSGSRRQMRGREALIVAQVALTMVLLAGAGLLARSFAHAMAVDPGFRLSEDLVIDTSIEFAADSPGNDARRAALQDTILARVRALPGVTTAGLINAFPLGRGQFANGMFIEMTRVDEIAKPEDFRFDAPDLKSRTGEAEFRAASTGYFEAMGIPLLRGRLFDETDAPNRPHVAVISRSLAERQWPGRDPLGRFIQFGNMDGDLTGLRVVGVVGDVRELSPESLPGPMIYVNARQRPATTSSFSVIARGPGLPALAEPVRRIMREVVPDSPYELSTVSAGLDRAVGSRRFNLWLIGAFAAAALGLAMLGVYGLVAYAVSQRSREMGIRVALGAEPSSLVRLVLKRAAALTLVGSAVGLGLAFLASGAIAGMLYGVTAFNPVVLASVAAIMLGAALAASYLPARRILKQAPGEPHVAEGIDDGALEHPRDRPRADGLVRMFAHGILLGGTGGHGARLGRDGVVHEQLDAHRGAARRGGPARAVRRRLRGEEERRAIDLEAGDDVAVAEAPEDGGAERRLVEGDRRVAVGDREHRRDPRAHRTEPISAGCG
jgi:putative ABC transport system permease protein